MFANKVEGGGACTLHASVSREAEERVKPLFSPSACGFYQMRRFEVMRTRGVTAVRYISQH